MIALSGASTTCRVFLPLTRTRANRPGRSARSGFGSRARSASARPFTSTCGSISCILILEQSCPAAHPPQCRPAARPQPMAGTAQHSLKSTLRKIHLLQVHDGRAGGHEIRLARPCAGPRSRRKARRMGALESSTCCNSQRRTRDLETGRRLVDGLLGDVAGARKLLGAIVVGLRRDREARLLGVVTSACARASSSSTSIPPALMRLLSRNFIASPMRRPISDVIPDALVGSQAADGTDVGGRGRAARHRCFHRNGRSPPSAFGAAAFFHVSPGSTFSAVDICAGGGLSGRVATQTMSPSAATAASPNTVLRRMSLPRRSAC